MTPGRSVTLVLCTAGGTMLGALPAYDVPTPWWQEVADVVEVAKTEHGVDVTILRILDTATPTQRDGGPVAYLAQIDGGVPHAALQPWPGDPLAEDPLRAAYARPGGPGRDLAWACEVLAERGIAVTGRATQLRTWNLSSIWRIPTSTGPVWLKAVPSFYAHEGALIARLDPAAVPLLLGASGGRMLLADVPGEDQYGASGEPLVEMVQLLVGLQQAWLGRVAELRSLGLADWSVGTLPSRAPVVLERYGSELAAAERRNLEGLIDGLPARFADLESCGIPDTLVHGDFHPGNVRGRPGGWVLLDWGDAAVGHPLLDSLAFCSRLREADCGRVRAAWGAAWRRAVPGCDPARAAALLAPIAPLRAAVLYSWFLDSIEPDERRYHVSDPLAALRTAGRGLPAAGG